MITTNVGLFDFYQQTVKINFHSCSSSTRRQMHTASQTARAHCVLSS